MNKLEGMLVYVCVDRPTDCYDKEKGKEWKAGVVVDEDTADAFAELYPKQAARKVKRVDFQEQYNVEPPEGEEKNLYVITLKKNTKLANGEDVPDKYRPRVYLKEGNVRNDVTFTKLVANGSKGIVSIDHQELKLGNVARLQNVLVTELIEYERKSGYEAGSEFDDEPAEKEVEAKAPAKKNPPKAKVKVEEKADDSPF